MDAGSQRETLQSWIDECPPQAMVFFGGAGVSTESGIPDFRSSEGLYNNPKTYPYPPEVMISRSYFDQDPKSFFDYYCNEMLFTDVKPNDAHRRLAELEAEGKLSTVVTQNIDGLHQAAGSKNVLELHGSVLRNYCMQCHEPFALDDMLQAREAAADGVPRCHCGGIIKPDVVLYEEPLDGAVLEQAVQAVSRAKLLVVAGTSLVVYPAAGLLSYFQGDHLVIINRDSTPSDGLADLCIHDSIGKILG